MKVDAHAARNELEPVSAQGLGWLAPVYLIERRQGYPGFSLGDESCAAQAPYAC